MPFVYCDESEWPDDYEPPAPQLGQFVYLPPPEFGGPREPVRFTVPSPSAAPEPQPRSLFQRLFARPSPLHKLPWREQEERRMRELFAIMVPALREIGVRRLYCRYDGGNDEGFAWLDRVEMRDGRRLDAAALHRRLSGVRLHLKLHRAGLMRGVAGLSGRKRLAEITRRWLVTEWAAMLLGHGFGTGDYSMFGAFTVDLDACTIADDPKAEAVVENIRIAT